MQADGRQDACKSPRLDHDSYIYEWILLAISEHPAGDIDQPHAAGQGASGDQAGSAFTTRAVIVDWYQPLARSRGTMSAHALPKSGAGHERIGLTSRATVSSIVSVKG
jgi:hypothetical protein